MIPKNVQMPNPNPKYKPPGTPARGRGGTLMEIEKLIERLQNWDGIKPDREIDCAIEGLKALQAELERVRVERDTYKVYFMDVSSKPDCNTCEKKGCEYRPRVGDTVRANCPLYSGPEKEE